MLHDISLRIAVGEFVVLKGRAGAGKTTLLNIIAGIIPSDRGVVTVNEHYYRVMNDQDLSRLGRIAENSAENRRRIGRRIGRIAGE